MSELERKRNGFLLRLPTSLRQTAMRLADEDCTSLNHFITLAIAEKCSRLERSERAPTTESEVAANHSPSTMAAARTREKDLYPKRP